MAFWLDLRGVNISLYISPYPDSKVYRANMGPTWVLSVPAGPHVGPMNLTIRVVLFSYTGLDSAETNASGVPPVLVDLCGVIVPLSFKAVRFSKSSPNCVTFWWDLCVD